MQVNHKVFFAHALISTKFIGFMQIGPICAGSMRA